MTTFRSPEYPVLWVYITMVPGKDTPSVLGKVLQAPDKRIFYRDHPTDVAAFHLSDSLSIDERCLAAWELHGVDEIHFVDRELGIIRAISRENFVKFLRRENHGAGWQMYVSRVYFEEKEQRYRAGFTSDVNKYYELLNPPVNWTPIAPPTAPVKPRKHRPGA